MMKEVKCDEEEKGYLFFNNISVAVEEEHNTQYRHPAGPVYI